MAGPHSVSWNTPAWSLSCEIFFYLAFPLAAIAIGQARWPLTLTVAAIACCMTQAMWRAGVPDAIKQVIHLADFVMGIAAACAYELLVRARRGIAGAWLYVPDGAAAAGLIAFSPSAARRDRSQYRPAAAQCDCAGGVRARRRRGGAGRFRRVWPCISGRRVARCTSCTCRFCGGTCDGRGRPRRRCTWRW